MENSKKKSMSIYDYYNHIKDADDLSSVEIDAILKMTMEITTPGLGSLMLQPCVKTIGTKKMSEKIRHLYEYGTFEEKVGALKVWRGVEYDLSELLDSDDESTDNFDTIKALHNINYEEYLERRAFLIPEFMTCTNAVLPFYYKWALIKDFYLFEDIPDSIYAFYKTLKREEDKEMLKKLNPTCNFNLPYPAIAMIID